tara:strand:- start:231 stop:503 length:273 start_codon:yes stop_codon:yes gene_type:complete
MHAVGRPDWVEEVPRLPNHLDGLFKGDPPYSAQKNSVKSVRVRQTDPAASSSTGAPFRPSRAASRRRDGGARYQSATVDTTPDNAQFFRF